MKKFYAPKNTNKTLAQMRPKHGEQDDTIRVNYLLSAERGMDPSLADENQFFFSHIGHGGLRAKKVAVDMFRMGVKRGLWDFVFMKRDGSLPIHWIEMKYGDNDLSKEQKDLRDIYAANGHTTDVCWSPLEALRSLQNRGYIAKDIIRADEFGKLKLYWPNGMAWHLEV